MSDDLSERLDAVERTLTGGETTVASLSTAADVADRLDALEAQATAIDERVTELEAATQALRGYVGGVRAVNRDVERRADAALAGVESLAEALDDTPDDVAFEAVCSDTDGAGDTDGAHDTDSAHDDQTPRDAHRDGGDGTPGDGEASEFVARLRDVL